MYGMSYALPLATDSRPFLWQPRLLALRLRLEERDGSVQPRREPVATGFRPLRGLDRKRGANHVASLSAGPGASGTRRSGSPGPAGRSRPVAGGTPTPLSTPYPERDSRTGANSSPAGPAGWPLRLRRQTGRGLPASCGASAWSVPPEPVGCRGPVGRAVARLRQFSAAGRKARLH